MKALFNRLYADYLMPSRFGAYRDLIDAARDAGYVQTSLRDYVAALRSPAGAAPKILLHRHDIDTDLRTARKLFEIEQEHGIKASYYFRLSTLDLALMREIEDYGSEASYHYEELSTFAKRHHIRDAERLRLSLPQVRREFAANFARIEQALGRKMATVAAHGDFANRRLRLSNSEVLADQRLRERCGIVCEAYDPVVLENVDIYISDRPYPHDFHPAHPRAALGTHDRICLLTHPRQFETNWRENTKTNVLRAVEEIAW